MRKKRTQKSCRKPLSRRSQTNPLLYLPDGTPYKPHQKLRKTVTTREIVAGLRVFPDGTVVDLVRGPAKSAALKLLVCKDGMASVVCDKLLKDGVLLVPPAIEPSLGRTLQFPSGLGKRRSARELFDALTEDFFRYVHLDEDSLFLVVAFVLSTHFIDDFPVAPYLALTGRLGSGKTTLLTLLHCMCRRAFMVGDVTPSGLYRIMERYKPTLLIDECESDYFASSRVLRKMLRIGTALGVPVIRYGKAYDVFGAKVICGEWPLADAALASRCLHVNLIPSDLSLERLDRFARESLAAKHQPDLLSYAIHNRDVVKAWHRIEAPAFSARSRDLVLPLAAAMGGDAFLEKRLVQILAQQDYETRQDLKAEPLAVLVRTLYQMSHEGRSSASAGGIALAMERWGGCNYSPRRTGSMVRSLRLKTISLGSIGRGILLEPSTRRSIHRLARDFGLRLSDILDSNTVRAGNAGKRCAYCEEFGLNVTEEGKELKFVEFPRGRRRCRSLFGAKDSVPI